MKNKKWYWNKEIKNLEEILTKTSKFVEEINKDTEPDYNWMMSQKMVLGELIKELKENPIIKYL